MASPPPSYRRADNLFRRSLPSSTLSLTRCVLMRDAGYTRADAMGTKYCCLYFARGCCPLGYVPPFSRSRLACSLRVSSSLSFFRRVQVGLHLPPPSASSVARASGRGARLLCARQVRRLPGRHGRSRIVREGQQDVSTLALRPVTGKGERERPEPTCFLSGVGCTLDGSARTGPRRTLRRWSDDTSQSSETSTDVRPPSLPRPSFALAWL